MLKTRLPLLIILAASVLLGVRAPDAAVADPGAVTVREAAFGLPHIYADTDLELARENGREIAKDRLGQLILLGRVGRGTLYQAFGAFDASTFNADVAVRQEGYTSSELNEMFNKLPADIRALTLEYAKGVNDTIDAVYAGSVPEPLEVNLLRASLGLGSDLFGNATNVSDQVDPYYKAPGGADPEHPNGGFQFTPEIAMAIAVLQVRNFGSENFGEVSRLDELNGLLGKFPADGDEIWDDLNFLTDPLAPVSVPDATTPGYGGPLASRETTLPDYLAQMAGGGFDGALDETRRGREQLEAIGRRLGAWPAMGSYAWMIDGQRSATGNPWVGGFPQTGIQTPSIMHFVEHRSAEGTDHRIQAIGMEFVGAPIVLIGQTDNVAFTSTTAQLKTDDFYLETLVLENTDALRYNDEGTPAPISMRTELVKPASGPATSIVFWRTHERSGNGGSRTVDGWRGDRSGTADSATAASLTDAGAFSGDYSGGYVAIVKGKGAGQMRPVLSNTADTLTLAGGDAWSNTPNNTSEYVAVRAGTDLVAIARERAYWLEESTTAYGFSLLQRAEDVLDVRQAARLIPSTHNLISADNQSFNGIGTDLGAAIGNTGYYSAGFSRVRQGVTPTDTRLPLDGTQPNELVVVAGTVDSATAGTLTATGDFTGESFTPPAYNYRLNNPSEKGSEYIVTIIAGDGARQTRRVASNTDDVLTLEEDWGVTPSPGDLYEVYEIVAIPEAINPSSGYSANWNNKAATADDGRSFGRQFRVNFILERLAADSSWTREKQHQLNDDLAGLGPDGKVGRYLIPRLREAVDAVGNGGNAQVDTVLAALEAHNGSPEFGRYFTDPISDTAGAGEVEFLNQYFNRLSTEIYGDEFATTGVSPPTGARAMDVVQHAIDSAAGSPAGRYAQSYSGDYFNGADWRVVIRDVFSDTITDLGGIPADIPRPNDTYAHPLSGIIPSLVFDPTPTGNRGAWEQIIEVGPVVNGEFMFPLGQSGFINSSGTPDPNADSIHPIWRDWRFLPMLHVAEDLAIDPDGDVDNDGVLDGYERWYFGSTAPAPTDDFDGDGADLLTEYLNGSDPTDADTDDGGVTDGLDSAPFGNTQDRLDDDDVLLEDNDGDGLTNGEELNTHGTDPLNPDTDGGGAPDGMEVDNALDPLNPADDVVLTADDDGDGCTNFEELGPNPNLGGGRDPNNPYDFYDITNSTLVLGTKDKGVSGFDLSLLLQWGGAMDNGPPNPNGKDYDDDTNSNTIEDGLELDYAGLAGPTSGPDGGISGFDLSSLLMQGGDSCVAPP